MNKKRILRNKKVILLLLITILFILLAIVHNIDKNRYYIDNNQSIERNTIDINNIPPYNGNSYIILNNQMPKFEEKDFTTQPFENYSNLDIYGRCGVAFANICIDIMPKENDKRKSINYKPTGWEQNEYPYLINTRHLYNRCHLIAWQLTAENNKKENLMTGTAYLNQAMIEWENKVANYIKENEKNNYHVLYRVTPIFKEENKLASGLQLEAMSVEERERGIYFNVYFYNVQPGIEIDYATGKNYEKRLLN